MAQLSDLVPGRVYTRSDVGMPAQPGGTRRSLDIINTWVTHWTTGDALGVRDTASWTKRIYDFHTGTRGWADIGYNYLVDRFGNVFVGRGRYRVGAHAQGHNTNSMGVAYLGGHDRDITSKGKLAMLGLLEWFDDSGIAIADNRLFGHRDLGSTSCPGQRLHSWTRAGMPRPDGANPEPDDQQPDGAGKPDFVVAVVASNEVDEGMARILGRAYQWRFLGIPSNDYEPWGDDSIDGRTIGTAVRVGAARNLSRSEWSETHDVGGTDRNSTATAVWERIESGEGDSRSV